MNNKKVLLFSDGVDSYAIAKIWKPDIKIYININGDYNKAEIKRLPADVKVLDFSLLGQFEEKDTHFVPLRNLYFLMLASHFGDNICFGATKGDRRRFDKTPKFINMTENLLRYTMGKGQRGIEEDCNITIERRFSNMYKHEIIKEYLDNGGDIKELAENSFSCYTPINDEECMHCRSCFKKYAEMLYFGYEYSEDKRNKLYDYLITKLLPEEGKTFFKNRGPEGAIWKKAAKKLLKEHGEKLSKWTK